MKNSRQNKESFFQNFQNNSETFKNLKIFIIFEKFRIFQINSEKSQNQNISIILGI